MATATRVAIEQEDFYEGKSSECVFKGFPLIKTNPEHTLTTITVPKDHFSIEKIGAVFHSL